MSDEQAGKIGEDDQLRASIKSTAEMTGEMFSLLRKEDMTRMEAFLLTQTWLSSLLGRAKDVSE